MTLRLFDTHAHLNTDPLLGDVDAVVEAARQSGLEGIAVIGIDVATSRIAVDLAGKHSGYLHAVVGIQPNTIAESKPGDFEIIEQLAAMPGVRGIGETGLDTYWDDTPLDQQQTAFDWHMDLCRRSGLPMVIHMRECGPLIVDALKRQSSVPPGIMHSFTGDWDIASECLDAGLMISFAGMVTFKKSDDLREVARRVPADRLLVETDAPYLSPEPLRGKRPNRPERVEHTLRCLAEVRGVDADELAEQTTENAKRIFQLP
ncbi:MAG: TatD family hydrolase [Planctomycetota bacterium]